VVSSVRILFETRAVSKEVLSLREGKGGKSRRSNFKRNVFITYWVSMSNIALKCTSFVANSLRLDNTVLIDVAADFCRE
jgi:hypothetical protein